MCSVTQEFESLCSICNNQERVTTKYALRLNRRDHKSHEIDLALCEICAPEILATSWIEQRHVEAADD